VQTKMSKNRGLMALTALAMLAMLAGLGWTAFRQTAKAPSKTTQQTTTTPPSSADAAGTTDTNPVTAAPEQIPATYKVATGDTLSSIAAKFYHDGNLYGAIEQANNLVGKRDQLVEGMELKLPTAADVASIH
jgi:nucleoid-associated protein YgaU